MHRTLLGLLSASLLIQPAWAQSGAEHVHPTPAPSAEAPSETPCSHPPEDSGEHAGHSCPAPADEMADPHAGHDMSEHAGHEMSEHEMPAHEGHEMPAAEDHDMSAHAGHGNLTPEVAALMERARSLGSGTALIPQTSPMRMLNFSTDDWLLMGHGDVVLGYNQQGTTRGAMAWAAENWAMGMASRYLGPGILDLRIMGSLEALTLPPGGTPHLFQTGETYQGQPLRDKQHPHDLLMELAARYTWQLSPDWSVFGYAGLAGEPALGPSAFMHRPSSADNHWAPLAHHLQDATHITYGLGTLGARWRAFQLEASLFNGREPDENRFDLDFGPLDSWSARASWIPSPNWVTQVSHGRLKDPEALLPGDVWRTTASVTNVQEVGPGLLSSTLVWGMNQEFHDGEQVLQSFGLESQYDWDAQRNHVYGRLEVVDKNALALSPDHDHALHRITALTLGGIREIYTHDWFTLGLGADATVYFGDAEVQQVYGGLPYGFRAYLRLRPPTM